MNRSRIVATGLVALLGIDWVEPNAQPRQASAQHTISEAVDPDYIALYRKAQEFERKVSASMVLTHEPVKLFADDSLKNRVDRFLGEYEISDYKWPNEGDDKEINVFRAIFTLGEKIIIGNARRWGRERCYIIGKTRDSHFITIADYIDEPFYQNLWKIKKPNGFQIVKGDIIRHPSAYIPPYINDNFWDIHQMIKEINAKLNIEYQKWGNRGVGDDKYFLVMELENIGHALLRRSFGPKEENLANIFEFYPDRYGRSHLRVQTRGNRIVLGFVEKTYVRGQEKNPNQEEGKRIGNLSIRPEGHATLDLRPPKEEGKIVPYFEPVEVTIPFPYSLKTK